jgi:uncharacterized membrane protein YfcA
MIWGKSNNPSPLEPTSAIKENIWKTITIGIFAGITVSLSGLGGGIVMVPLFRILLNKPMKDATALSLSIVPMLAIASLANYSFTNPLEIIGSNLNPYNSPWQLGYLYFPIILPMIIATFITTSFAQKNAKYVPVVWLRIIFALLSSTIFIKTLIEIYKS